MPQHPPAIVPAPAESRVRRVVPSCRGGASSLLRLAQPPGTAPWFAGAGAKAGSASLLACRSLPSRVLQAPTNGAQLPLFPKLRAGTK